jgi:glycosyltransferase involved in cell wall biosynthesis
VGFLLVLFRFWYRYAPFQANRPVLWTERILTDYPRHLVGTQVIPRLALVDSNALRALPIDKETREKFIWRLRAFLWGRVLDVAVWERWNRHYRLLLVTCKALEQIDHFKGSVVVDDFDPHFEPHHIGMLNRNNVIRVITTNAHLRDQLLQHGVNKPIDIIPTAIDFSTLDRKAPTNAEDHQKRDGAIVIGHVIPAIYLDEDLGDATFAWNHLRSISFLTHIMKNVWKSEPDIELWLIGSPSKRVHQWAEEHTGVRLLGYVPHKDLLNTIARFDIAVYPRIANYKGRLSRKLTEYMGCGVPVVSTDVGEAFVIEEARSGVVVPTQHVFNQLLPDLTRDPAKTDLGCRYSEVVDMNLLRQAYEELALPFAAQILHLAADEGRRKILGRNGTEFAIQYDLSTVLRKYNDEVLQPIVDSIRSD